MVPRNTAAAGREGSRSAAGTGVALFLCPTVSHHGQIFHDLSIYLSAVSIYLQLYHLVPHPAVVRSFCAGSTCVVHIQPRKHVLYRSYRSLPAATRGG